MNWGALAVVVGAIGVLVTALSSAYSTGAFRQEVREMKDRLADHASETKDRFNDHAEQLEEHSAQLALQGRDIASLAAWRDGYNAAVHAKATKDHP